MEWLLDVDCHSATDYRVHTSRMTVGEDGHIEGRSGDARISRRRFDLPLLINPSFQAGPSQHGWWYILPIG
jgi:hypothetical protein